MLSRILVGVSGTQTSAAKLRLALDLAKRHGSEVTALSIVDVERLCQVGAVPLGAGHHAERWRAQRIEESHAAAGRAIDAFAAQCRAEGVPVRVLTREGDPIDVLIDAWRYHDLCVLGVRSWFDHEVVAEPTRALLKLVAAGVRPLLATTPASGPIEKVLVAYNGSLESAKAMKQFAQLRLWPEAALEIVCVGHGKTGEEPAALLGEAAAYCRSHGYTVTTAALEGVARDVLLEHTRAIGADLIVLGSSFKKVLTLHRFGTNALTLLKTSEQPLFLSH